MARTVSIISSEIRALDDKAKKLVAELDELADAPTLTRGQEERFDNLTKAAERLAEERAELRDELAKVAVDGFRSGRVSTESGDGATAGAPQFMRRVDVDAPIRGNETPTELRDRAQATIERGASFAHTGDSLKHSATNTVRESDEKVAEHIVRFGSKTYADAFAAYMANPDNFAATASPEEREALRAGFGETRATLATSGISLPSPLDPTIYASDDFVEGSILARVTRKTTGSNVWRGLTSDGVTASYDAEGPAEVSDDTPSVSGTTLTTRKAQAQVNLTLEVWEDAPDISDQIVRMLAEAKIKLDEQVAWNGAGGSNQPIGIWTAVDGGSYEITPTTAEAFGPTVDLYSLVEAVPPRFRNRGEFGMELSTYHEIHKAQIPGSTTNPVLLDNGLLIGRPFYLSSVIDPFSGINAAATADNPIVVYGDHKGYFWVTRIGMSVSPPQLLQNSNAMRFDGTAGVYAHWRAAGDVLIDGSLAVLNIATTA